LSASGAKTLAQEATARDFVSDAFAHCKFIAYAPDAMPLFRAVGLVEAMDAGCIALEDESSADDFIQQCRALRFWVREPKVKQI
ncbi:MAG: catalase HPII, partial [Pseudomonadota bacterium]|nr:catalase HPII [Pseudomonadota bacterium]